MVDAFRYLYLDARLDSYDRSANPDNLNVWQLSADGIEWSNGKSVFTRMFDEKGTVCLFPDKSGFAIVETNRTPRKSQCYFVDENNEVLAQAVLPDELARRKLEPYDVLPSGDLIKVIYVDPTVQPYDYQVDFSPCDLTAKTWGPWK